MFRTLYARLSIGLLLLFVLIALLFTYLIPFSTEMYHQETSQKLNEHLAQHILSEPLLFENGTIRQQGLDRLIHMMMVINPSIEVYLLDPQGKILTYSAAPGKVQRESIQLQPIKTFLEGKQPFPILGDDPRNLERQKAFSAALIQEKDQLKGYLYVILGGEQYDAIAARFQQSYVLRLSAWSAAAGIAFTLVAGLFLFWYLTRRLRLLAADMNEFHNGDFQKPIEYSMKPGPNGDEVDRLAANFQALTHRVLEQVGSLRQADTLRRELIANVSHDLRTPLTTLQGYLETLKLKEEKITVQEKRQYLNTAIKQCHLLRKLVTDLFELAKLDSKQKQLQLEPFSLPELVHDVLHKFELQARKKNIRWRTNFSEQLPFVAADIRLIERVLDNLIVNALRYTPQGGTIEVDLLQNEDNVTVQIKDTGCGIAEQDLPKIFDRFYRPGNDRTERRGGAGLGLAIVKRILELHGEKVRAQSRIDVGTTFTFQLPLHTH